MLVLVELGAGKVEVVTADFGGRPPSGCSEALCKDFWDISASRAGLFSDFNHEDPLAGYESLSVFLRPRSRKGMP